MTEPRDPLNQQLEALPRVDSPDPEAVRAKAHAILAQADARANPWLSRLEPALWIAASAIYLLWAASSSFALHQ